MKTISSTSQKLNQNMPLLYIKLLSNKEYINAKEFIQKCFNPAEIKIQKWSFINKMCNKNRGEQNQRKTKSKH